MRDQPPHGFVPVDGDEAIKLCLVRILAPDDRIVGAGALVSSSHVITCAHVVNIAANQLVDAPNPPDASIKVEFAYFSDPGDPVISARVVSWRAVQSPTRFRTPSGEDIAVLEMDNLAPKSMKPAVFLTRHQLSGHPYRAIGFPNGFGHGQAITGGIGPSLTNDWIQIEGVREQGYSVAPGFSGAPVWDDTLGGFVGIVVAADESQPSARAGAMIRTLELKAAWSPLPTVAQGRQTSFPDHVWSVPHSKNPYFTNRDVELERLHTQYFEEGVQRQALLGLGGIGKTQVALEYAWRHRADYSAVFWISADTDLTLIGGFRRAAELLGLPAAELADGNLAVESFKRWLESNESWLMVLDQVEAPAIVEPFLPSSAQGHILITSRLHTLDVLHVEDPITIEPFKPEASLSFLLLRTGRSGARRPQETAVAEVAEELDHLPIFLDAAGAYIQARGSRFDDYLTSYRLRRSERRDLSPLFDDHGETLIHIWDLPLAEIKKTPATADLLRASAFLSPSGVPFDLLILGAQRLGPAIADALADAKDDMLSVDELLLPALRYSLIRRTPDTRSYTIHSIAQQVLRNLMSPRERRLWAGRVVDTLECAFPDPLEFANWGLCESLIPHVQVCKQAIQELNLGSESAYELLRRAAAYLSERAQYTDSKSFLELAEDLAEKLYGRESAEVASVLHARAWIQTITGDLANADHLYFGALEIQRSVVNRARADIAATLNDWAWLVNLQGMFELAGIYYREALEIRKDVLPSDDARIATNINDLGWLCYNQGRFEDAERHYHEALAMRQRVLSDDHPDTATTMNDLARLYRAQGKYGEAEALFHQALRIRESTLGSADPRTAATVNDLAWMYSMDGRYEEAETHFQRALGIRREVLGGEHPDVGTTLNDLGVMYTRRGQLAEAERSLREALQIRKNRLGDNHPDVATTLNNLGWLCFVRREYDPAEVHYRLAIRIREVSLGEFHPDLATSLSDMGRLLVTQCRFGEAEQPYRDALQIREKSLGPSHPEVVNSLNNLAWLLSQRGDYAGAEDLYARADAVCRRRADARDPQTAMILCGYGWMECDRENYARAEQLLTDALAIRRRIAEPNLDTATVLNHLGWLRYCQDCYQEAEPLLLEALCLRKQLSGDRDPDVGVTLGDLGLLRLKQGRIEEAEEHLLLALEIAAEVLPTGHLGIAASQANLARLYCFLPRLHEAEQLCRSALATRRSVLSSEHHQVASTLHQLALIQRGLGDTENAESAFRQAVMSYQPQSGPRRSGWEAAMRDYLGFLQEIGRSDEADGLRQESGLAP